MEEIPINFMKMKPVNKQIKSALTIWHKFFEDEMHQYSEFEPSDIEYFVGCMLYNSFNFEYALETMKTIDLSYDFLSAVESNYDEVQQSIEKLDLENEADKLEFLLAYLNQAKTKYTADELYLLNRLSYHVEGIKQRYENEVKVDAVDFVTPKVKSRNPLDFM